MIINTLHAFRPPPTEPEQAPMNAPTNSKNGTNPGINEYSSVTKPEVVTIDIVWKIICLRLDKSRLSMIK